MGKSILLPDCLTSVESYAGLCQYTQAFAEGHLNLLIILGGPGLGKSRYVRQALGNEPCWINGNATPFGIYQAAYEHRDEPIVLDDVDALYRNPNGLRLLKALCQAEPRKTVSWHSDIRALEQRDLPQKFTTSSHVILVANEWKSGSADTKALEDRGHVIVFNPGPLEVHCQAAEWFWDQEIFDFVGEHLSILVPHSLRIYLRAWELKKSRMDWRQAVLSRCLRGTALKVAQLKADSGFLSEEERVRAFVDSASGSRATYFNQARKLIPVVVVPQIRLKHSSPPSQH